MLARKLWPLALMWLMMSCATFGLTLSTEGNLNKLKKFKTPPQPIDVIEVMGEPSQKERSGEIEIWSYEVMSDDRKNFYPHVLIFKNGLLQDIRFDTDRGKSHQQLIEERSHAKEDCGWFFTRCPEGGPQPLYNGNGAPPLQK